MPRPRTLIAIAAFALPAALAPAAAEAERFAATDSRNRLYTFDDRRPGDWKRVALTGIGSGERIVGLDVRPANRQLFAMTDASRLYVISRGKRTATPVGAAPLTPALSGSSFGFDFNPTVDRIRVVSNSGQNLRLHPDTGKVAFVDGTLSYKAGDPGAGTAPAALASAYTNSVRGATMTSLFNIDTGRDALTLQAPPNDGVLATVGSLGVNLVGPAGFDISARDGRAWVLARRAGVPRHRLYRLDLTTGRARQAGAVSRAPALTAFAALSAPATAPEPG